MSETILLGEYGSRAFGTHTAQSDHDYTSEWESR